MSHRTLLTVIAASCLYLGSFTGAAHAYLDPASGSAFMSAVIGIVVAVGVVAKTYWYKLRGLLGLNRNRSAASSDVPRND